MNIEVNGVNLYYEVKGQGEPLVMVHGNGEDHLIFEEAVSLLQFYYTCYIFDSRGHGNSTKVNEYHYQDMANDYIEVIQQLHLKNVTFYGFSDGGIIGLLIASQTDLLSDLIISGANISPDGVKKWLKTVMKLINIFKKDPLIQLMMVEPHISINELQQINIPTLVLAGEKDVILESETRTIHKHIKNSKLKIIKGMGHGDYIVHKDIIADIILEYKNKKG